MRLLKGCFALVRPTSELPAVDVLRLLDPVIFNLVVGNFDAHGKNFSILYGAGGARLAPLYDLLSTVVYPALSPKLAMRIGRRATLEEMDPKGWAGFAADAEIGLPLVRRRVGEPSVRIGASAFAAAEALAGLGLDADAIARHGAMVVDRAERCALTG